LAVAELLDGLVIDSGRACLAQHRQAGQGQVEACR
jgi:hypothetical protein